MKCDRSRAAAILPKTTLAVALVLMLAPSATGARDRAPSPTQKKRNAQSEQPGRLGLYAGDVLLPGYGTLRQGRPGWAATFALTRTATVWLAFDAYVQMVEYRSAERAARVAIAVRGPGLLFPDPYSNSFRSADEFQRLADRRAAIMSGAATLHVLLTGLSLLMTHAIYEDHRDARRPIFQIAPRLEPTGRTLRDDRKIKPGGLDFAISVGF